MESEVWRVIADAPDYAVSSLGRFRRETPGHLTHPGKMQSGYLRKDGYLWVIMRRGDGKRIVRALHRQVCIAFHGPPPFPGAQVAHLDGTRTRNLASNLRWKTAKGNAEDRDLHGRTRRGVTQWCAKLDDETVRAIRNSPLGGSELARRLGVNKTTISAVRNLRSWRHVA